MPKDGLGNGLGGILSAKVVPDGFDADLIEEFFASNGRSTKAALQPAIEKLETLLGRHADDVYVPDDGDAAAKPSWGGGGSGGGGGGGGKGKNKGGATDGGVTTDPGSGTGDSGTGTGDTGTGTGDTGTGTGSTGTGDTGGSATGGTSGGAGTGDGYATADYVSGLDTPDGFNIAVNFSGGWTSAMKQSIYKVVEQISDIVTGDLPGYNGVDDFHLTASLEVMDGVNGVLGRGGTRELRPDSYLPSQGALRFDTADADKYVGTEVFDAVIFHEVLHAMGFGTIWGSLGLIQSTAGGMRFTGENATLAYNALFPAKAASDPYSGTGVPVSSDGAHWDQASFTTEIMTPSLYVSGNYVSDMTIATLEDMGYETVFNPDDFVFA
ncbi:MAG: hypothetical protein KDK24_04250 [Pseudooceanicola sp.]|nr:hypothetical protein [Pseudooceanicola sp.]